MSTLIIKNIGKLITGDIKTPVSGADTIVIREGKISKVGSSELLQDAGDAAVIDAAGTTVAPGLIDSHGHPVLGDFSPRQKVLGFIEGSLHGGVTTMISAGEPHTPGRPKDPAGVKALAVLAHKSSGNIRPGGVKLHGGALILEKGLTEEDIKEVADQGVWLVGEVGLGSVKDSREAAPMVEWAKKYGMKVVMHTGGVSIPGSSTVTVEDVLTVNPDVVSHLNGGPTAVPPAELEKLIDSTQMALELVQCGNPRAMKQAVQLLQQRGELHRIILGNDAPSGTGFIHLGIMRSISFISSLTQIPAEQALCMATGNTARTYELNTGLVEEGREADLVIMDAPMGSAGSSALEAFEVGDLPGISLVVVDGQVIINGSSNTPPPTRKAQLV